MSVRVTPKLGTVHKYEHLVNRDFNRKSSEPQTWLDSIRLAIWGKSKKQELFDEHVKKLFKPQNYGKGKLGQDGYTLLLENPG